MSESTDVRDGAQFETIPQRELDTVTMEATVDVTELPPEARERLARQAETFEDAFMQLVNAEHSRDDA